LVVHVSAFNSHEQIPQLDQSSRALAD
jgi:hypothetical protein